ncbi:glycoside hydrolase family 97 catalytic domain-containing protein [Haloferula rosea]|uniref:Glycoside hydrolase family 97 catalytic domain-containing protein n=1 Tax=Haloferula rosea TaxID=490093 RepID=A0A934RBH1_9BACT|nr:glycoside hydrolase family 97 catalytic domain-containing protein [Haloferula rosea]MBK1826708.1 glycoside hydrolase family 97 catalytic domain-containing protein [Haloferula rosea]
MKSILLLLAAGSTLFADPVEIRNRFPKDGMHYLGAGGDPMACTTDARKATWTIREDGKSVHLIHEASGKAFGFVKGTPRAVDPDQAATLSVEQVEEGWVRLRSAEHGMLHTENRQGGIQVGDEPRPDWWSAQWEIVTRTDHETLSSPDGRCRIHFSLANGRPEYSLTFGDELILSPSPLGLVFKDRPPLTGPFKVIRRQSRSIDETWKPVWGQQSEIRDHGEELSIELEETATTQRRMILVFRAHDDGVAFRYILPEQPNLSTFAITEERTTFHFAAEADAWWCEDLPDTYERDYRETPLSEAAPEGMQTPATFRTPQGSYVSIHEAALVDWAGMKLKSADAASNLSPKADLVPWFDSDIRVKGRTPMRSPWRTIQLAKRPGGLIESSLILNLNEPSAITDTSWIEPSKFMGIWWGMITNTWTWDHDDPDQHGATTERAKRYIDACAEVGATGLLVEGWCEGWSGGIPGWRNMEFTNPTDDFDILEVVKYGRSKGVRLVGHHETGGDIPNYERQAEAAFNYYRKLGINTVKTGYVTGDKPVYTDTPPGNEHHHGQYMVRHYQRIIELAAKYQIMIDAHEPIKPTGLSRTWPNFVAREGARGGEFNSFVGNPPRHTTILPFTRILGGPMDYTPGLFDCAFQPDKPFSTRANQLALYVVLWSPLQMAADHYQCYQGEAAATFIRRVPVGDWDETRILDAGIGDYIVTARRKGKRWYVGAVNDENPRTLKVDLGGILDPGSNYEAILYADAADADYRSNPHAMEITKITFKSPHLLELNLRAGGGAAIEIHPAGDPLELPEGDAGTPPRATPLRLRAKHSDRALTSVDGTIQQKDISKGSQQWMLEPAEGDQWRIVMGDLVLAAEGNENGAPVRLETDRKDALQRWRLEHVAGSYYHIVNADGGRLLDVIGGSYADGAATHLWEKAHVPSQVWWIDPVE